MNSQRNVLSCPFVEAHGVTIPKPLRDWLTRVSFLARAQPSLERRELYEKWALHIVEDAVKAPGGVAGVNWAKHTTVMPSDATDCTSEWWSDSPTMLVSPGRASTSALSASRDRLLEETLRRAPAPLQPYVMQGFSLYDKEVANGQRNYNQVTFVEMLNIANNLHAKAAASSTARQPQPPPMQQPLQFAQGLTCTPPQYSTPPPTERAAPSVMPSSSSSGPVVPQKRKATATEALEVPLKRRAHQQFTADVESSNAFFLRLAGVVDGDAPSPRAFVGTSTALERNYTRYEPLVEDIRPFAVLQDAYVHITSRASALEAAEGLQAANKYLSDQLKGMRQDLRVQNIVNDFTVMVYEAHARLCLRTEDIGEFNQCQAGLKQFYAMESVHLEQCDAKNFFLYRLVYLTLSGQYDSLSTELINFTNAQLHGGDRVGDSIDKAAVNRALAVCDACNNGDTMSLCRLLLRFNPEMTHLVRIYLQKLRIAWLKDILAAMKGSLTLRFLMASLGFTPLSHGKKMRQLFWLDDNEDDAEAHFAELFQTLKLALPPHYSFHKEVTRAKLTQQDSQGCFSSIDAATALTAVNEYLLFLGTRKDSGLG